LAVLSARFVSIRDNVNATALEVFGKLMALFASATGIASCCLPGNSEDFNVLFTFNDENFIRCEDFRQTIRHTANVAEPAPPNAFTVFVELKLAEIFRPETDDLEQFVTVFVAVSVSGDFLRFRRRARA
jgi:hypothetical protein